MIEQSESIKNLAIAMVKAQMEVGAVSENATNPFFKSKYADLGEHIKTIKPVFAKQGLVISQFLSGGDGQMGVTTILMHESGEWLKSTAVIELEEEKGNSKAQTAGKAISYLRRYALAAVANVYSGDDNDGNIVQQKQEQPKQKKNGKAEKTLTELGYDKKKKYKNAAEVLVGETDIDNTPHAAQWLNLMVGAGVTVTKDNAVEMRNIYNENKAELNDSTKAAAAVKEIING